jgi:surface protein
MSWMFYGAENAKPDTSRWNVSNVTNMREMFSYATNADPDTSEWNVPKVTDMNWMFNRTNADPDVLGWMEFPNIKKRFNNLDELREELGLNN